MSAGPAIGLWRSPLRYSQRDALLIGLALVHGAVLVARPPALIVALAMWWCANTVAHHFIHRPFFRRRLLNWSMALYLSALLGFPQTVWRDRHLAHHAHSAWHLRPSWPIVMELLLVFVVWTALLAVDRAYFLAAYLPGIGLGLGLCWLHGYYEHASGTTSHYGRIYNRLFFNDGYHVEHHANAGLHWTELPERVSHAARASRWPPVFRWLDAFTLNELERLALCSPIIQRFLLDRHERAFRRLLSCVPEPRRVAIVGGGLFPRTALVLSRLLPRATLVVIDATADHIRIARPLSPPDVDFVHDWYDSARHGGYDLIVIPLAFIGDRSAIYRRPSAGSVVVHDWIWRPRGASVVVSLLLLKRLNLVAA